MSIGWLRERLLTWFPEREFFMRSEGQVRFIKVTSYAQIAAASCAVLLVGGFGASLGAMAVGQYRASTERASLLARESKVQSAERTVAAFRDDVGEAIGDLERRQKFLEDMTEMLPADAVESGAEAKTDAKLSAALPEAGALARIEARQLALADRLTSFAEQRAERTEASIRKLGLSPRAMLRAAQVGQGGPLETLSTEKDGSLDSRFERAALSLARMDALERGWAGVPRLMPADMRMISSGFGVRSDPFTGHGARHAGLDFAGHRGAPIHAAADGRVSFVGRRSDYGKVVEISHGNGMLTRYAHLSDWKTKVGETVEAGEVIGAMGSTGRSTGPHLHFEVRINGQAVNPRPFLETAPRATTEGRRPL